MVSFEKYLEENPEYKERYERLTDEEKQQLTEAAKTVECIVENLFPTIQNIAKQMFKICERIISLYPNKRVVHLAKHSKKERVRKKNIHRIIKDVQRYIERERANNGRKQN